MSEKSKGGKFTEAEGEIIFDNLSKHYRILAPVKKPGAGRFSGTDRITYDTVNSFADIDFINKTYFSAKSVLTPVRETMFRYENKTMAATAEKPAVIIFLRSCDIHALAVTDLHFLNDGGYEDTYYKNRRDNIKIFLIECAEVFATCFCVSLGTNKTGNYSGFIRKNDHGYEVIVNDDGFKRYFPAGDELVDGPRFASGNQRSVTLPETIDSSIFADDIWEEYSNRCLACGRCNVSCPTCTCFTVQDVAAEDSGVIERTRIQAACMVKNFSLLAGNHDFRARAGDRLRYRILHKIIDFKKRNGAFMCVGCGRCDDVCPEYISTSHCIEKINRIAAGGKQ